MASHTIDVLSPDQPAGLLVVVGTDLDRLRGATPVLGDGADVDILRIANVQNAIQMIVAVAAVRCLNSTATTLVREPQWRHMSVSLDVGQVVVDEQTARSHEARLAPSAAVCSS